MADLEKKISFLRGKLDGKVKLEDEKEGTKVRLIIENRRI